MSLFRAIFAFGNGREVANLEPVFSECLRYAFALASLSEAKKRGRQAQGTASRLWGTSSKKAVRTRRGGGASGSLSTSSLLDNAVGDIPALQLDTQQIVTYRQAREVEVVGVGEGYYKAAHIVNHIHAQ